MQNFVQPGDSLTFTAPAGGVVSGLGYLIGSLFIVAAIDAAEDELFTGNVVGVFELVKTTGETWTEGQKVYWNSGTSKASTTAGGNTLIGAVIADAASADTTGKVRLDGVVR